MLWGLMQGSMAVPIIIAGIILIVLYTCKRFVAHRRRSRVKQGIDASGGTADGGAVAALEALDALRATGDETTQDVATRALLLHRFVDDGAVVPVQEAAAEYRAVITHAGDLEVRDREFALRQAAEFADEWIGPAAGPDRAAFFDELPRARVKTIDERRDIAVKLSKDNLEAAHRALDDAAAVQSDPQNVHDTTLVGDMRDTIARLKAGGSVGVSVPQALESARTIARKLRIDIAPCAALIKASNHIYSYGENEDEIFRLVWNRSLAPENASNQANLQESIVRAMSECATVCIQGRCSRYVGALAAIDVDPQMGNLMTSDAYRNQIFGEVRDLVDRKFADASTEDQEKYAAGEDSTFARELDQSISAVIRGYDGRVSAQELEKILVESKVYAGI